MRATFWLRWSWRDLRRRAPQVVAIALIIALGAGIYAGLASTSSWRRASLDATYARSRAHDAQVSIVAGSVPSTELLSAIEGAADVAVASVETRLVTRLPATVERRGTDVVAAGELVGVPLAPRAKIDRWSVVAGRDLGATDRNSNVALLDVHFARRHHLPPTGIVHLGPTAFRYVGLVLSPQYLDLTTTSGEAIQGKATRAVVFTAIGTAQRVAGLAGRVNNAVVRFRRPTTVATTSAAAARLQRALGRSLPGVALTVVAHDDEPQVRALYGEISSEQHLFDVFALLILAGAGFAAFNLTKRVVEAQRRDIGIAMSLGVTPRRIAIRPMLLALEITVTGVALGAVAGWAIATWVLSVIRAQVPLPYWITPFDTAAFARGALLGLVVPLAASAFPVWRALHVRPVDALLPPHLQGGHRRLTRLVRRLHLPGTITVQTPLRRLVRAPARSVLTIGAIAFIMAPLLAAFGTTDSATATIDTGDRLLMGGGGDRLLVDLAGYQSVHSTLVESIVGARDVARAEPGLDTGGYLRHGGTELGVSISMVDLDSALSAPASIAARHLRPGGIVVSEKAAADLHVRVGDRVVLRHPKAAGTTFRFVDTSLPVSAVHSSPYRFVAYMDLADESIMGLQGIVNTVKVQPRPGVTMAALQRELASRPGVASAMPVSMLSRTMRDMLAIVGKLFLILQVVVASLAFLVAYNASNVGVDERRREHATMFAFGIPVRRALGMAIAESMILGAIGVAIGLGFGAAMLRWILTTVFPAAVPDLAVLQAVAPSSYWLTIGIAMIAVAAAPWLNLRRLRAMDIASTLRVVE